MIIQRCGNCGSAFNAAHEHDQYCGPCRGLPKENDAVIMAIYGIEPPRPPYPWCSGNPTVADCISHGYCRRDPNCGE